MKTNGYQEWPSSEPNPTITPHIPQLTFISPDRGNQQFRNEKPRCSPILSLTECTALDKLIGLASLYPSICERLIMKHDDTLLSEFGLSETTRRWLVHIEAKSLNDFVREIVSAIYSDSSYKK